MVGFSLIKIIKKNKIFFFTSLVVILIACVIIAYIFISGQNDQSTNKVPSVKSQNQTGHWVEFNKLSQIIGKTKASIKKEYGNLINIDIYDNYWYAMLPEYKADLFFDTPVDETLTDNAICIGFNTRLKTAFPTLNEEMSKEEFDKMLAIESKGPKEDEDGSYIEFKTDDGLLVLVYYEKNQNRISENSRVIITKDTF